MPKKNKITLDERQSNFLIYYLDPKSKTFSNALQSALRSGYSQEFSENITSIMPKWLSESIGKGYLVNKAESNLKEFLETASEKVKADITKFVLERLSKSKYGKEEDDKPPVSATLIQIVINPPNKDGKVGNRPDRETIRSVVSAEQS